MRRTRVDPRPDWQRRVESLGFDYHTPDGETYWVEDAGYEFTEAEVDILERATEEVHALCMDTVERIVAAGRYESFALDQEAMGFVEESWRGARASLYGRMDLSWGGVGEPKLLEYNADTPTALFEASVVQWFWVEDRGRGDQFNSIHEKLISRWAQLGLEPASVIHFAACYDNPEDAATCEYLRDTCLQAGFATDALHVEDIGFDGEVFFDLLRRPIAAIFKLYPWDWMLKEEFGPEIARTSTRWLEPAWKLLLADKAILPLLWEYHRGHPNLLAASFDPAGLDGPLVRKPCAGREGEGVVFLQGGEAPQADGRPVFQSRATLPAFDGRYPVIGSWVIGDAAAGVGIREDATPITRNTSHFVPHRIV